MTMETVRCADCGYLAARQKFTRHLVEVELGMRSGWTMPLKMDAPGGELYEKIPICFAKKLDFERELKASNQPLIPPLIEKERPCNGFIDWQHGLTPKEHWEMDIAEKRRQADLAWQDERRKEDAKERADRLAQDKIWNEYRDKETRRWQLKLAILAAIFALLNGFAGIIVGRFMTPTQQPQPPQVIIMPPPAPSNGDGR